jgi:hypothetical protein
MFSLRAEWQSLRDESCIEIVAMFVRRQVDEFWYAETESRDISEILGRTAEQGTK